ncbi:deoxynucleoside kinase domain-containing protein [Ditylenchus destructor]|uniref:NADH dehydrogenase [ubiquinone] 1 alpha subcomplex subunit 10, mitochondrial n=1 Tax=Ditylenchus destructor TaxID=166010 RepID=A0AAD4MX10_9BILA|nr:deoxynucleoside kinase domain-containing protein [Ditylenchus destructor]
MTTGPISGVLRFAVGRFGGSSSILAMSYQPHNHQQKRTIVNKSLLKLPDNYPDPWPYKELNYNWENYYFDRTKKRLHENSKLIVIEGNTGSGKTKIGQEIADILGFHYMPEFKMDDILIDRYGNDLRKFYHRFPKSFRYPDTNMFFKDPYDDMNAAMQSRFYFCRWEQYLNALAHLTNTGQGVILERTPHSDFVFANAMRAKDYIGLEFFKHYYYVRKLTLSHLKLYPHLIIFLDCPVSKCIENIKERGNPDEIAIHDSEYLRVMDESYKDYLRDLKRHSKILVYDWEKPGNADNIVEDIEHLDFDFFEWHTGDILETWNTLEDDFQCATTKYQLRTCFDDIAGMHEVAELYQSPVDLNNFMYVMKHEVLKSRCGYGYTSKDPRQGMGIWKDRQMLPESWYEYELKELYYDMHHTMQTQLDPNANDYDPHYQEHAH